MPRRGDHAGCRKDERGIAVTRLALIAILAIMIIAPSSAAALPCLTKAQAMQRGENPRYRDDVPDLGRCWYVGKRKVAKDEFEPPRKAAAKAKPERKVIAVPPDPVSATPPDRADQARLDESFNAIDRLYAVPWHLAPWQNQIHYNALATRLDYSTEFPPTWAMAARWP